MLGIQVGGYFIGGRGEQEAKRSLDTQGGKTPSPPRLLTELSRLLRIAEHRSVSQEVSDERTIRAHKLGLEVMAQDLRNDFIKKDERRLQREMCRFLVESHVRAYGTKFDGARPTCVPKTSRRCRYRDEAFKSAPTERDINRWLTQLGSYLDQEHLALRGVLVLYNFSPTAIICPVATIRLRYLILAINLCPDSPSKRKTAHPGSPWASIGSLEAPA